MGKKEKSEVSGNVSGTEIERVNIGPPRWSKHWLWRTSL